MVVFSNRRLGASAEMIVSNEVAVAMLRETSLAAQPFATSRWEIELVRWLEHRATPELPELDVGDIAWTPDHFEPQQQFVVAAIGSAARSSEHGGALQRWQ